MSSGNMAFSKLLTQFSTVVKNLGPNEIDTIMSGEAKLILLRKGYKVVEPVDLSDVARQVRRLGSQDDVIKLLDGDKRLTGPILKELAGELNISLPTSARLKVAIQRHIAQSVIGYRERTHGGI